MGRLLILAGIALVIAGVLVTFLGRLPGDLTFRRGGLTVYFPLVTSIVVSVVLTVLLNLFFRGR